MLCEDVAGVVRRAVSDQKQEGRENVEDDQDRNEDRAHNQKDAFAGDGSFLQNALEAAERKDQEQDAECDHAKVDDEQRIGLVERVEVDRQEGLAAGDAEAQDQEKDAEI